MLARSDELRSRLATRIPKELHHRLKVHCVETETQVMDFTIAAIRELLERKNACRRGGSSALRPTL